MPQMMPLMWNIMPLLIIFSYFCFCLYVYFHFTSMFSISSMISFFSLFEYKW